MDFFILQKQWDPNFPLLCISFLLCMDLQPYSHNCFSKILRTLFDFRNNTYWVSFYLEKQLANIPDKGFLYLCNTLLLYSLSPYWRTERQTETQIHLLRVGWRNLFPMGCCVSFLFWREIGFGCTYYYVLRVPYSCGVVLVFLVLAGNRFWCYVRT